jgi:predicted ATPase
VDPSTLEFRRLLVAQAATARLYVLLTWRPEFQLPWPPSAHQTTLTLGHLLPAQVAQLATQVAGGKPLPPAVLEQLVAKTEGVPLLVEELTEMVLASGLVREEADRYVLSGPLPPLALPPTVQAALVARLEQLGEAQAVAQVGVVWGRGFTEAQLQAVAPLDQRRLDQALARLVAADVLREVLLPPRMIYVFNHALLQEAAYASLPLARRQQVHGQVAQVLAERFPETVATQPELVAYHYTEAGVREQAIAYWQRAGQQARQRSAYLETVRHLTTALELLATLPDTPARAQQELDLRIALGSALNVTKGTSAPEVAQTYARARALCTQVGEAPHLFPILEGLWRFYWNQGALPTARELGQQLVALAQYTADPTHRLVAHSALGSTLFHIGDYTASWMHLEQGITPTDLAVQRALAFRHGEASGVRGLGMAALTLWCLGYPAQAVRRSQEALALARELGHPHSLAGAQHLAAFLHQRRREAPAAQRQAEALLTPTAQGLGYVRYGTCWRGWALAIQGEDAAGRALLRQALAAFMAIGHGLARPLCLVLLAEAEGHAGQVAEGLRLLAEALPAFATSGRGDLLAEAYRLQGALLLRQATPDTAQAEACFQQALAIARRQQAKSWELRAAMSLSHLWQQQGKSSEARELLAPIYGWFTEGFDTADLQEAKALLEELA